MKPTGMYMVGMIQYFLSKLLFLNEGEWKTVKCFLQLRDF